MRWAKCFCNVTVIFTSLILVLNDQSNRRTGRFTLEYTRKNFKCIVFFTLRRYFTLTRFSPIKFCLNKCFIDFQSRWTTINGNTDSRTMRFSKCSDLKKGTVGIRHSMEDCKILELKDRKIESGEVRYFRSTR